MNFKKIITAFLNYNSSQKIGLIFFFILIIGLQISIFCIDFSVQLPNNPEKQKWLSLQTKIDSLKEEKENYVPTIYPFNPNFITDYKGYKLGMSTNQIDKLLAFRKTNQYVNSAQDFQAVTGVSDSLLAVISPYFKFPDWVKNKNNSNFKKFENTNYPKKEAIIVKDINAATKEDLMKVYGIGEGFSDRILKEKEKYGNFVSMEQLSDVWGLPIEAIDNLNKSFKIIENPKVKKIKINQASIKDLMQFPLFRYALAKEIVIFRSKNGEFTNIADLTKINGFPSEKIKIIALYLEF